MTPDHPPRMNITLPRMLTSELRLLQKWAHERIDKFTTFAPWIAELVTDELNRRKENGSEPGMASLPAWNGEQLSDVLTGSYVLVQCPLTENLARFADDMHRHIVCNCAAALETLNPEVLI